MKRITRAGVATAAIVVTTALTLAGCGDDNDSGSMPGMNHGSTSASETPSAAAGFNDADVTFATGMIPHHRQAVEMADLATKKAGNATVKQLAAAIKAAQDPEIQQMSGWLTGWGKPVPTPGMDHSSHDMSAMPGTMTAEEMADLGKATGAAFDRMWVQMMIKHHQGAVTMAKTEQTSGSSSTAIELAEKIETDQNREITTMQKLLTELPAS
jgi:uncharacterized protein (DUF305 family)